jgi:hypothetical protein
MTEKTVLLNGFNEHFMEFISDICRLFPDNLDIKAAKLSLNVIKNASSKTIIKAWRIYVVNKYSNQIDNGDITFFTKKEFVNDLTVLEKGDKIVESIIYLSDTIKLMEKTDQDKTMKYIQNLKNLSLMYFDLKDLKK